MKKFFKNAASALAEAGFSVCLDGKPIKTPMQNHLCVPTKALADEIAKEWNAQGVKIDYTSLQLTRFANSTIDSVAVKMDDVRDNITSYANTDLLFYRADAPEELQARQSRAYDPILAWLRARDIAFHVTKGIVPVEQPQESLDAFRITLQKFDAFALAAMASITTLTGSACLALAVAEEHLPPEAAWDAAHIDEDFQIERWGRDDEATARRAHKWKEMEAACRLLALVKEPA